jgi:hypothetical protein
MTDGSAGAPGIDRFRRALAGDRVEPPVCGLSFVDPGLLAGGDGAADLAGALARACARASLDFAFVPSWEPWAREAVALLDSAGIASAWVVPGVLWRALESFGVAEGLRASIYDPRGLDLALGDALDRSLEASSAGFGAGVTALVVADDMAGAAGPLLDPAFLRSEVFPMLARFVEAAAGAGLRVVLHCDGDARLLYDAAAAAGVVAVHGDAGGASGLARSFDAARAAGLAFVGGVPTAELSGGSGPGPARWRGRSLDRAGGFLVSDDGGVTTAAELDTLLAILRGVRAGRA